MLVVTFSRTECVSRGRVPSGGLYLVGCFRVCLFADILRGRGACRVCRRQKVVKYFRSYHLIFCASSF